MELIRSFIAIEIDETTKKSLIEIQDELKKVSAELKLVDIHNIHLTLHFLGNIPGEKISSLKEKLASPIAEFLAFRIKPAQIGAFPNLNSPRVIWVGIEKGREKLIQLQKKIAQQLEKLDIQLEARQFHPHLTLARIKGKKNLHFLSKRLKEMTPPEFNEILVKEVILFKSILTPEGPIYEKLDTWPLAT